MSTNTDYGNNSLKNRENKEENKTEKKEVTKVVKGKTGQRKKSEVSKIAGAMIQSEGKAIKDYVIYDVIIPAITETLSQMLKGSVDMLFHGEVRSSSSRRGSSGSNASRVSYRDFYEDRNRRDRDDRRITRYSYDDITFEFKDDALEVLDRMDEIVEQYGVVRVSDLFEMAGRTGNGPTDHNYGWTSTRNASVERDRSGEYYIKIGRPSPIR